MQTASGNTGTDNLWVLALCLLRESICSFWNKSIDHAYLTVIESYILGCKYSSNFSSYYWLKGWPACMSLGSEWNVMSVRPPHWREPWEPGWTPGPQSTTSFCIAVTTGSRSCHTPTCSQYSESLRLILFPSGAVLHSLKSLSVTVRTTRHFFLWKSENSQKYVSEET